MFRKGKRFGGYGYEGLGDLKWIKITVMGNELGGGNETIGGAGLNNLGA